jgi:hypothetical protein
MSYIVDRLRALEKEFVRLHRKVAMSHLEGPVVQRDTSKGMVRLALTPDPTTGEQVLSPWIKVAAVINHAGAGGMKLFAPLPPMNTPMRMISPSGVVGAASYAEHVPANDAAPAPQQADGEGVLQFNNLRLSFKADTQVSTVNNKGHTLDGNGLTMSSKLVAEIPGTDVLHSDTSNTQGA